MIAVSGGKGNGRLASSLSWCRIDEHEEKAVSLVYLSHCGGKEGELFSV